jgi:hypothetical protein
LLAKAHIGLPADVLVEWLYRGKSNLTAIWLRTKSETRKCQVVDFTHVKTASVLLCVPNLGAISVAVAENKKAGKPLRLLAGCGHPVEKFISVDAEMIEITATLENLSAVRNGVGVAVAHSA